MSKRVIITIAITTLFLSFLVLPALASDYSSTSVGFRYIGDIFHEKEVKVAGGTIQFQVRGMGEVSGTHSVQTSAAEAVYGLGTQNKTYLSAHMTGTTAMDAPPGEYLRLISEVYLRNDDVTLQTGMEMDPGESGYIRQSAASSHGPDGDYFKTTNHFGNTGGTTRRVNEVEGYMSDRMEVVGYAEVWEITERSSGNAKTGFWDMR